MHHFVILGLELFGRDLGCLATLQLAKKFKRPYSRPNDASIVGSAYFTSSWRLLIEG
jgi:hypothetical protein